VAASGLLIVAGMLVLLVWGAALGSSWLINGRAAEISLTEAAFAMVRLGSNQFGWDNVWPEAIEAELAGPEWFWVVFVAELAGLALIFWPLWRILGPNPSDPSPVYIHPPPITNPRTTRREREAEEAKPTAPQPVEIITGPQPLMVDTATMVPSVDRLLIDAPDGERLVLGRMGSVLVATEALQSAVAFGPVGADASSGLVAPALDDWRGPALVVAARPDATTASWRRRSSLGRTWLFDPTRAMATAAGVTITGPKVGHGWSPLAAVTAAGNDRSETARSRRSRQWDAAGAMASAMVSSVGAPGWSASGSNGSSTASQLLSSLLLAAVVDDAPVSQLASWVDRRAVDDVAQALARTGVLEAETAWTAGHESDPGTLNTAYQLLDRVLQPYDDPAILAQTESPEISVNRLLDGSPDTLYVVAPSSDQRLRPLVAPLLWEMTAGAMAAARSQPTGRLDPPLLVVLDGTTGYMPAELLNDLAASGGSLGIQLLTSTPGLTALDRALGGEDRARRLVGHHRAQVALSGITDTATIDHLSAAAGGERIVDAEDIDPARAGARRSSGATADVGGDWLRELSGGEAICLYGNLPPVRIELRRSTTAQMERTSEWGGGGGQEKPPPSRRRRGLSRWFRPSDDDDPLTGLGPAGLPDPLDSAANDRASARYWESVTKTSTEPGGGRRSRLVE
jgi:hypothetical protein